MKNECKDERVDIRRKEQRGYPYLELVNVVASWEHWFSPQHFSKYCSLEIENGMKK
jgi:hypothetical protein